MTIQIGVHFIRRRILRRAEQNGGRARHSSVFRCADGFDTLVARSAGRFRVWDEDEPAEEFVSHSDVLVGIPDIRLLNARERSRHKPPYLALVQGNATRAIPFASRIMERLQPSDTLVCSCTADCDVLRLFLDAPSPSSIAWAPMPSDLSQFEPSGQLPAAVAGVLASFDADRPVILSAERMTPEKGVHRIIPLAAQLRDLGQRPVLAFLGARPDTTEYQEYLAAQARTAGLAGATVFLPFFRAAELGTVYARSAFVVSASTIYDNNYGYIPIESGVAGTPPIATDWGGYRDIVRNHHTGLHMPTTLEPDGSVTVDWSPAASAAVRLLSDSDRYAAMAAAARQHVDRTFSISAALRAYSTLAETAVERAELPPWRISELGRTAVAAGWTDQTDNADRTARIPRGARPPSPDFHRIYREIYARYATARKD